MTSLEPLSIQQFAELCARIVGICPFVLIDSHFAQQLAKPCDNIIEHVVVFGHIIPVSLIFS